MPRPVVWVAEDARWSPGTASVGSAMVVLSGWVWICRIYAGRFSEWRIVRCGKSSAFSHALFTDDVNGIWPASMHLVLQPNSVHVRLAMIRSKDLASCERRKDTSNNACLQAWWYIKILNRMLLRSHRNRRYYEQSPTTPCAPWAARPG